MEERATSARYVSLVTQWGKKLSEAIHKLRQQEDIISTLKREKFELGEQQAASESKIKYLEQEKVDILSRHQEEKERIKHDFQNQLSRQSDENAKFHEDRNNISVLKAQIKVARKKAAESQSELSISTKKVGQLEDKISSLETELEEAQRSKARVEGELQRMKNGMDKLEATFASLDGSQSGEQVGDIEDSKQELSPVMMETETEPQQRTSTPVMENEMETKEISPPRQPEVSCEMERRRSASPRFYSRMPENNRERSTRTMTRSYRPNNYHGGDEDGSKVSRVNYSQTRIENTEKLLECRICKKRFNRMCLLKEHLRLDHHKKSVGSLGCISCGVPFNNRVQFMQHRRQFHHLDVAPKPEYMPDPRLTRGSYARYNKKL